MGHPQDIRQTVHGMPPPYQSNSFRSSSDPTYGFSGYPNYNGVPLYQTAPQPPGYLPSHRVQPLPSYVAPASVHHERRPGLQYQTPLPPRSSGVAVVIPSPQTQRTTSTPIIASQHRQNTQISSSAKSNAPTRLPPQLPPVDYQLLLLSLAEDYLAAAHGQGSLKALVDREINMRQYYKLVATGLSCLEVVLKRSKLQPQMEATVRLRYASVLYDETLNMREAEQTLSEGIRLCDRYRLFDLKYNMEHLLALVLFEGSPRASLKFLDGVIKNAEAYKHSAWVYGMRFLKVSLLLKLSTHQDILSALSHIRNISAIAEKYADKAILAVASTLEALIHLRGSSSAESIEQAQRALAIARSLQLDPKVARIPQVVILTNIVDLSCSLQQYDSSQAVNKMQAMHASLASQSDAWHSDGTLLVPVRSQDPSKAPSGHGIVRIDPQGSLAITFHWTPWEDVYVLGFLLSSIATAHKNTSDGLKSEQMLKEGIRRLDDNSESVSVLKPISTTTSRHIWRQNLKCFLQTHLVFALCTRTAWVAARESLDELKNTAASFPQNLELLDLLIQYLEGVINQGIGHLDTALSIFQRPHFSVTSLTTIITTPAHLELAILSTLNSILIIRDPSHLSHHLLPPLLSSLDPHIPHIKNSKPLTSAYNLILATSPNPTAPGMVKTKQYIHNALSAAKAIANNQLLCITLSLMSDKFFKGVVGEQSEKSARASEMMARKGADALWKSVGAGVVGATLELAGRGEEAEKVRDLGREIARGLPEGVVQWEEEGGEDVDMR
ncbi:MAG: hypothetical protein Q9221_000093 [Calogaya cf. arnoldii]